MAAQAWQIYNSFKVWMADATFDMDADTFKLALFSSASNAATLTTNQVLADLTNQLSTANGYTSGGISLSSLSWAASGSGAKLAFANPAITPSGGSLTFRFAVIYKVGTANTRVNPLVAVSLLDTTPADIVVNSGVTFTFDVSAGIFTIS
jgi:hypothetical protein